MQVTQKRSLYRYVFLIGMLCYFGYTMQTALNFSDTMDVATVFDAGEENDSKDSQEIEKDLEENVKIFDCPDNFSATFKYNTVPSLPFTTQLKTSVYLQERTPPPEHVC